MTNEEHILECAVGNSVPCPAGISLHSELPQEHWWSGWPGAYCMKCGSEDPEEICLADCCLCQCHAREEELRRESLDALTAQAQELDMGYD